MPLGKISISSPDKIVDKFVEKMLTNDRASSEGKDKVQIGSYVMIKKFPVIKSILSPRFQGPYKVISVKGHGKCITVVNEDGKSVVRKSVVRNIQDIKQIKHGYEQRELKTYKYEATDAECNTQHKAPSSHLVSQQFQRPTLERYPKRIRIPLERYGLHS